MARGLKFVEPEPIYERLDTTSEAASNEDAPVPNPGTRPFSWVEYGIFLLLGIAMLWAWNMFLAAAPYFQRRFKSNENLLGSFQATEISVSTVANLGFMVVLTKRQVNASYPRRIALSLTLLTLAFALLALSTKAFRAVGAVGYFAFFVVMVAVTSASTGLMQNGTFSFVSSYGRQDYMQGIMTGQAVAGVLPPLVQIISVLSTGATSGNDGDTSTSAMIYFLTATGVSVTALVAFIFLLRNYRPDHGNTSATETDAPNVGQEQYLSAEDASFKNPYNVPLSILGRKLFFRAAAVFLTFAVTMVFPVFTQQITSTSLDPNPLFDSAAFIPLSFLVWNIGDLVGRLVPAVHSLSLATRPKLLLILAIARVIWIPLYLLCNITKQRETVNGIAHVMPDAFYLLVVQFPFGFTNGYLGSCAMMGTAGQVDETEREAAGGFMGLVLIGGLATGSLCSFFI